MTTNFDGRTSATNPQFSANNTGYGGGDIGSSAPNSHYNTFSPTTSGYSQQGGTAGSHGPGQSYGAPPTVSVTDYGSSAYGPPHGNPYGPDNRGYEEDFAPPTDFDALFSGKSRPSVTVSGMDGFQLPSSKANQVLGLNDPHNLVYENSGFSRTVHFDPNTLTNGTDDQAQAEQYARRRRGFLPSFMSFDTSESLAASPKKSKSLFVSKGQAKNAHWLEWSEKMRVEGLIKKEEFLKKQEEAAKKKLPTPIRKARQESVKFVNPASAIVEEETPLSKAIHAMEAAAPTKSDSTVLSKDQIRDRYTEDQWQKLHEYWGHSLFRKSRPLGYIIAFLAMAAAIPPLLSSRWVKYRIKKPTNFTYTLEENMTYFDYPQYNCSTANENGTCYEVYYKFSHIEHHGLWYNCTDNITSFSGINDGACEYIDRGGTNEWQSAILGLLLFSLAAGLFASFLTTWGVCATSLARKVYFYHSAGEIFLVCGICSIAALISYPAILESRTTHSEHYYGIGYFLGWGMPLFYLMSAFCMTLDDMIHSLTNDCCIICRRKAAVKHPPPTARV